jgi:hypothetical protein
MRNIIEFPDFHNNLWNFGFQIEFHYLLLFVLELQNDKIMFCQRNFFIVKDDMFVTGLASIHLVKYSTATTAYWTFPYAVGSFLMMSIPHLTNGQVGSIVCKFIAWKDQDA